MSGSHYWARIVDNKVVAVIAWDGVTHYPESNGLVELPYVEREVDGGGTETVIVGGIGWDYVDGEFVDNRPVEEPEV